MITLDNLLIESDVLSTEFLCDVAQCKGACCTLKGGGGAPVADAEVERIQSAAPVARKYLSPENQAILDSSGGLTGSDGNWETVCVNNAECVFVSWEGGIAKCSFERAYHAGESTFRKPLSCHLFPIRVHNFGGPYLRYEVFDECAPGRENGKKTGTLLVEMLREALTRAYGEEVAGTMVHVARTMKEGNP